LDVSEFVSSLPESVINGENITLPNSVVRKLLKFAEISNEDVFYHLGCGVGNTVQIAAKEFGVKGSIGVEIRKDIASLARNNIRKLNNSRIIVDDIRNVRLSDATLILFWFTDEQIIEQMIAKFKKETTNNLRVLTISSPLSLIRPSKVNFPFFLTRKPFEYSHDVREQIETIHGTSCLDFTGSWDLANRYVTELEVVPGEYQRFVTMIQCMVIWINAWNMGIACETEIPPPVNAYIGILKEFYDLDLSGLIL
jgi:trans-aconitate methyltransferase